MIAEEGKPQSSADGAQMESGFDSTIPPRVCTGNAEFDGKPLFAVRVVVPLVGEGATEYFAPHDPEVMITCHDELLPAYVKAGAERHAGKLIAVCSDCTPRQVQTMLSAFPNLTHGFCPACARVRMAEIERERVPLNLGARELLAAAKQRKFSTGHPEPWRNRIAAELNLLLGTVELAGEFGSKYLVKESSQAVTRGNAMLRLIERVAQADRIEREKPTGECS